MATKKKETPLSILKQIRDILIEARGPVDKRPLEVKSERFIKLPDGWVKDIQTGLEWGPSSSDSMNWGKAKAHCEKADGRLPTVRELESLIDRKKHNPATDLPGTKSEWYWTCEDTAWYSCNAWYVVFSHGSVNYDSKDYNYYVRPVRSSQ